ncbi:Mut7-C RNAse domain-containing protein [Halosegnis marinus]|uniref:Mut7-C RNAse domain-containing protein n=1 Tax=Halosegnis marinus TaxID=3034023 RepID=A0ABD5ZQC7_9EURY|nr:Mut7-C RNAse domain-containing protein [Halosegnis sp. DT85]
MAPERPDPPFLLDVMCGKLATYLRFCGYDAAYALDRGVEADDRLLALARDEGRTLLTRDRELADRAGERGVLLTDRGVEGQLRELADAGLPLAVAAEPAHCGACNGPVEAVAPGAEVPEYAPAPDETEAWRCRSCGQYFWKGSHWDRVEETLAGL